MSEQEDVIEAMKAARVIDGLEWAFKSATRRTMEMYSENDGHDASLFGNMKHTYFHDRLDRVFACEKYAANHAGAELDPEPVFAELSEEDQRSMPVIAPGVVVRNNLTQSPGWQFGSMRFLLASCPYGEVGTIRWSAKSPTKQKVARQAMPEVAGSTLFDLDDLGVKTIEPELDIATLVVVHSLHPVTADAELAIGRPRYDRSRQGSWHWREDLLIVPSNSPDARVPGRPEYLQSSRDPVPDAPVRLRKRAADAPDKLAGGS